MAKSKFKELYCQSCKKQTRMIILKEPENNKGWFECTKCHHSYNIDLNTSEHNKNDEKTLSAKDDCLDYSPEKEYSKGDSIYHLEWDDIGLVEAKETISDGKKAIRVKFQKSGVKKLIENYRVESEIESKSLPILK